MQIDGDPENIVPIRKPDFVGMVRSVREPGAWQSALPQPLYLDYALIAGAAKRLEVR